MRADVLRTPLVICVGLVEIVRLDLIDHHVAMPPLQPGYSGNSIGGELVALACDERRSLDELRQKLVATAVVLVLSFGLPPVRPTVMMYRHFILHCWVSV